MKKEDCVVVCCVVLVLACVLVNQLEPYKITGGEAIYG